MNIIEKLGIESLGSFTIEGAHDSMEDELFCFASSVRDIENQRNETIEALINFLKMYIQLVNCGDCGNWNPFEDKEVIVAIKAIEKVSNLNYDQIKGLL